MIAKIALILLAGLLPACVLQSRPPGFPLKFDPSAAAYVIERGTGRVEGQAFLQQETDGEITPASGDVLLMPVTAYQTARMQVLYPTGKTKPFGVNEIKDNPPGFQTYRRSAQADEEGRFTFADVKAGSYYVVAPVSWTVGGEERGAYVYELITVAETGTTTVVMSGR